MRRLLGTLLVAVLASFVAFVPAAQADESTKRAAIVVPNLAGQRLDKAIAKLKKAGISESRLHYTAKSPTPIFKKRWRVCAQAPKASKQVGRSGVTLSIRRTCATAFKRQAQREVPYMRDFNHPEDWKTLAEAVCDNYDIFTYGRLSKAVATYIDKKPYEGEVDDLIRIAHKTNCPEKKGERF